MKKIFLFIFLIFLVFSDQARANCQKLLDQVKELDQTILVITFDGLGTAQIKGKLLKRKVYSKIEKRCGSKRVVNYDVFYSKSSVKKTVQCVKVFIDQVGPAASINIIGHSFGAGKGVFNFINEFQKENLIIDNAITFDPRGYAYRYTNPKNKQVVRNFINFYQAGLMAGREVKNADHERKVNGANHINLPEVYADHALRLTSYPLTCAHR